jgi:enhancer of polycomb-like protein
VANESYICFRHREIKAVRKTRAQQATPSDKVIRLRQDLTASIEIARLLCERERLKRDLPKQVQFVWTKRVPILDLKRNFASLGSKEDEDLLVEKERVPKKLKPEAKYVFLRNLSPSIDPF